MKKHKLMVHEMKNDETCSICGKVTKACYMKQHMKERHGGEVECNICGQTVPKSYEKMHNKIKHEMPGPSKCKKCGIFVKFLDQHMKRKHYEEKQD